MPLFFVRRDGSRARLRLSRPFVMVLAAVPVLGLMAAGVLVVQFYTLSYRPVPVVEAPTSLLSPTPGTAPDLPVITGEPADIGEDYTEDIEPARQEQFIYRQVPIEENVVNVLIVGSDRRAGQTGWGRSDTMMVLSFDRERQQISLVSLMRDCWVHIEGCGWNRLNAAYSAGGIALAINTVNSLFELDIQEYVLVDLEDLVALVDRIGGIDVNITSVEADYYNRNYHWDITAGRRHLSGSQTLVHARNRKSNGGDFERVRRQHDVMLAIFKKCGALDDPAALTGLLAFALTHLETNISPERIFTLATEALSMEDLKTVRGRIPADGTWAYADKDGRSVLSINIEKNIGYLHGLIFERQES